MMYKGIIFRLFLFTLMLNTYAQTTNNHNLKQQVSNNAPNIILIYVDDLGYGDLGNFWQNQRQGTQKMSTPNLDKMANQGAMLTHHYTAAPVCAPARASLLEGLHQGHASVRDNQFDKPISQSLTMAKMLSMAGYRTLHVGKAGVAGARPNNYENPDPDPETLLAHPLKRGFDQFFGYLYHIQGHQHYPQNGTTRHKAYFTDGYQNITENTNLTYTTDVFTAKAKQWIAAHEKTSPEQPFFMYLAYDTPHAILQAPTQAYPKGGGLTGGVQWTGNNPETPLVNTAFGVADSYIHPDYANTNWNDAEKRHATMIRRLDNAIADIIQLLQDLNIDKNTMLVFTSDNGPHHEAGAGGKYRQDPQFFQSYANMNGTKRDLWEAGIRVPTIAWYPGVIPESSKVDFPSGQWDWMATFAEAANIAIPAVTDGVSLMPSLQQDSKNQVDKGYIYHEYRVPGKTEDYADFEPSKRKRTRNEMQAIRMGDYKGVRYDVKSQSTPFEIYNVVTDAHESHNLANAMPELQQKMQSKVLQVRHTNKSTPRVYDKAPIPGVETEKLKKGLTKKTYQGRYNWVPNFEYLKAAKSKRVKNINLKTNLKSDYGLFFTGYINIPTDGNYRFYLKSTGKSHIMLHDIHILDNDFNFTSKQQQSVLLNLKAGKHPIRIYYQQNNAGQPLLDLQLEGPGMKKGKIPANMFLTACF